MGRSKGSRIYGSFTKRIRRLKRCFGSSHRREVSSDAVVAISVLSFKLVERHIPVSCTFYHLNSRSKSLFNLLRFISHLSINKPMSSL